MKSIYNVKQKSVFSIEFTLIECMVVITVIVILISILLPSLSMARKEVNKIVCYNNLKQINYAENMYLQDFNGYFHMTASNFSSLDPSRFWDSALVEQKYIDWKSFRCPERQKLKTAIDTNPSDYVPNMYVFKPFITDSDFLNISQIKYPSETLLILDMQAEPLGRGLASSGITSRIGYLHRGGINTLFVDGHTQWFRYGKLKNSYYTLERD